MQKQESFKQNQRSVCKNCGDGIIFQSDCWVHPQFISCSGGCLHPEPLDHKSATHYLSCRHSYNRYSDCYYKMLCLILKELPNNRAKILVFGDRRKKIEYCEGKQSIRYVSKDRLSVIPQTSPKGDFSKEKEHNISLKESSSEDSQISSNDETSLNNNIIGNSELALKRLEQLNNG